MRTLDELTQISDPAWPLVEEWIARAHSTVEVLPASDPARGEALHALQLTTRSPMGAIVYHTGGLLVDGGWLRLLGSGHSRLTRSLPEWNRGRTWTDPGVPPPALLVADDVLGGLFALNGGAFEGPLGQVYYFAPDSLEWEPLELGYSDFLSWAFSERVGQFYADLQWPGYRDEVSHIDGDHGLSIYPFLFAEGPPIDQRSRRAISMAELYALHFDLREQLARAALKEE